MNSQLGISLQALDKSYIERYDFSRAQVCQKFLNSSSATELIKLARKKEVKITYQLPIYHQSNPRDTYYLSKNFRLRDANFEVLEANLKMITCMSVEYVVIHFFSDKVRDESYESDEEFKNIVKRSLTRLEKLAEKYKIQINLEYSSMIEEYMDIVEFVSLIKERDSLGINLDIGELYLRSLEEKSNFFEKLDFVLKHANVIRLYNVKSREDFLSHGYIPVNPDQDPEDGWIDVKRVINIIKSQKIEIPIILESNIGYGGEDYFRQGVEWLDELLKA